MTFCGEGKEKLLGLKKPAELRQTHKTEAVKDLEAMILVIREV